MYQEIDGPSAAFASLFNAIVAPRPIGWISSISEQGVANLAPFSYFNAISPSPPMVVFSCNGTVADGRQKDTIENVRRIPEFVANFAAWDLREQMNASSASVPFDTDEFDLAGLERAAGRRVRPPLVAAAPANLECQVVKIVDLP
ncbi:MAG TPA: flavin reductase family protein, partial [Ramlibacter sp.]|nr:flavin reductase family protein [Ramlibacter sp.]